MLFTENKIITTKDLEYNLDKWKPGNKNILFITGLSGSGKSTKAANLAKENNAINIEVDLFEHNHIVFDSNTNNDEGNLIVKEYFEKKYSGPKKMKQGDPKLPHMLYDFIKYCMNYASKHKDRLFIIEGIQLADLEMADEIKGYPVIIVNTSVINSMYRAAKREGIKDYFKSFKSYDDFRDWLKWYLSMEKNKNNFAKSVKEANIENNHLYFLSEKELDGKILQPRIPDNYLIKNGYEDNKTKRVCFAPSINKCLMGLSQNCTNMVLNVYEPDGDYEVYKPTVDEVPDVKITGETWITKPIKVKKVGKIHVTGDAGKDGHKYYYGNNTAELYEWNYEWITESLLESSKYPEEIPDDIIELIKKLNSYNYGFVKNGKKIHGMNNFFEDYKSLSVSEFEKYEIGVCWDYVHYEADWFKKHGYKYETFYIQVQDEDNDCPSHTYLVFYLPGDHKPYYFESSWKQYKGIEKFNSITELHDTIKKRHIESAESKCDPNSYYRVKYNAESKIWEGLSCGDYMVKVSKGKIKIDEGMIIETNLKSTIDKDFVSNGKLELSKFTKIKIDKKLITDNKSKYKLFRHIDAKDNGYAWMDGDKLVGITVVDTTKQDYNWITAIEVAKEYQGYGLGKQLLDFAVKSLNGNALSVAIDNEIALSMYKKYGFKISKASLEDVKAGRKKVYFMYLPEVMQEFVLQKVDKSTVLYHGSPIQGLKYIEPRQESINVNVGKKRLVYATDDIRFAACYGTTWHDDIAKQGSWDHWNTVTMGISDKVDVTKPCSIYELYNDGSFLRIATKEVVSGSKIKVKREIRYTSYLDMLKDVGVEVITLDEYNRRLRASKSKYEQSILSESTIMENSATDNLLFLDISKNKQDAIKYLSNRGEKYKKALDDYNGEIIIDTDKDLIVGTVLIGDTKDKGFITDLWVHEYYRKNGLGKRLLDDAVKKYKGIDLTVDIDNDIAVKMYQNYGFVSIGYANNKKQYWMKLRSKLTKDDKILTETKVNNKGEEIPEKCPKCGGKIGLYLRGEPVYLCADCGKYFGVAPFNEAGTFTQFSMEEYRDYMVSGDYNLLTRYYDSRKSTLSSSQVYYTLPIRADELSDDIDTKYIEKIVIDKCEPIYKKYWKDVSHSKGDYPFKFYRLMQATDITRYNEIILDISHNPIDLFKNIYVYQYNFMNNKCRYSVLIFMKGSVVKKIYCMVYDAIASWIEIKFNNAIYESADNLLLPGEDHEEEITDIHTLLDNTDPKRIWLSSDWHLFQTRYKKERNYVNTQEIVTWCRQNIKDDDIFLYLGDVSYRFVNDEDAKKAQEIMASIPGIKVIILGNHDIEVGDYNDGCGFKYVFRGELKWKNIIFTHRPINMDLYPDDYWNIHGHMHKWSEYNTTDGKKNINVYPSYYNNKPVSLHYILTHTEKLTKNNKRSNWTNMGEASILENRSDLPDPDFGIPEDRKYPLDTEKHVRSAIKLFGHAEEDKKKALAKRIKQAADSYNIEIPETTQVHKYLSESVDIENNPYGLLEKSIKLFENANTFDINIPDGTQAYLSESVNKELEPLIIPDSVDTIVFNIGDVLTGFRVEDVYNHDENIPHDLAGTVIKFMNNVVWDVKQRNVNFAFWDLNTMKAHLLEVMPNKIKPYVDEILKATADVVYKYHYTDELLGALKSKGFKIYYLSNWDRWNYETQYATLDNITKQMDGGVFSFQVHNEKPSLSIYRTFLDKFNLEPDQCLFFDDKKENIEAAELVGMHGMIFDHNTTPIQILKSIYAADGVVISDKRVNDMIPIIKDGVLDFIDISQISWFHLSGYRNPGIPDKELYYKNIKDAILSIYSKAFKDDDLYIYTYVFTCTKKMEPICLGEICILRDKSWKWVIQYPLSIEGVNLMNNVKTKVNEWSMASCNPVQGITKPFILKVTNDSSMFGSVYAFSPDIVNDKYLVINEDAKLEVVDASNLNNMHVEEYKFVGDIRNIKKIEEAYKTGKIVDNTFFYTALTGKPMLSEDQIDFDPNFVKVDFVKMHEQLLTEQASLRDILYEATSNYLFNCPCYNPRITNMIGNRDDIKLYRDLEGYYVKNKSTNKRTASVEQVDLITETMISTVL